METAKSLEEGGNVGSNLVNVGSDSAQNRRVLLLLLLFICLFA